MASAFETALTGVQTDVVAKLEEATPFAIAIAAAFVLFRVGVRLVKRIA